MLNIVRTGSAIAAGAGGVVNTILAAILAISPPSDGAAKERFLSCVIGVGVVAIVGIVAFAIAEHIDKRNTKREATDRDAQLARIYNAVSTGASGPTVSAGSDDTKPQTAKQTLRQAALDLAAEIRRFVATVPDDSSVDEEHEWVFEPFLKTYWPRLRDIKDRLKNVLPAGTVKSPTEWLPTSKDRIQKIADDLERDAIRTPEDVPL